MGIKGFHQDTKHFIRKTHVSKYRGQRVGCDASAWLHRGAVLHAWYIVGPGKDDQPWAQNGADPPWVDFGMKMIAMLKENGVEPVVRIFSYFLLRNLSPSSLRPIKFVDRSFYLPQLKLPYRLYSMVDELQPKLEPTVNDSVAKNVPEPRPRPT